MYDTPATKLGEGGILEFVYQFVHL
jgi:hypothetical protein